MIEVLTKHGADMHARNQYGRSVLFVAIESAKNRLDEVASLLLDLGADPHSQNSAGNTALAQAAVYGPINTVKRILAHIVNIDTRIGAGDTALTLAAAAPVSLSGEEKLIWRKEMDNRVDWNSPVIEAARKRNSMILELLLSHGASIDLKNKAGNTALTLAAAQGKYDAVDFLLNRGANAHTKSEAGDTALSLAKSRRVRQLLLEHLSEPKQPPACTDAE